MKPVVLKFGGELLEDAQKVAALASMMAKLARKTPLVVVHGGGREIDASLARVGLEKRQVDGLRITDEPTLEVVVGVLAGLVNTRFVAALGAAGVPAVGLTGADAGVTRVKAAPPHRSTSGTMVDLGRVGEPIGKDKPALLVDLCRKGYVPVVSSIGASREGELFNVNADTLAAHLAGRLKSPRLIIAGATPGVLGRDGSTIADMTFADMDELIGSGSATAGMVAKLAACRSAIDSGTREVFVADGKDLAALSALARHGRTFGKSTRIRPSTRARGIANNVEQRNGKSASSRKLSKRAS